MASDHVGRHKTGATANAAPMRNGFEGGGSGQGIRYQTGVTDRGRQPGTGGGPKAVRGSFLRGQVNRHRGAERLERLQHQDAADEALQERQGQPAPQVRHLGAA